MRLRTVAEDQTNLKDALSPSHAISRPGGADRAAPWRDRRGERGGGIHTPAVGDRCRAALSRRQCPPGAGGVRARGRGHGARGQHRRARGRNGGSARLPRLLAGLLPMDVHAAALLAGRRLGVAVGRLGGLVFAALPLLSVRRVPPLAALRQPYECEGRGASIPGAERRCCWWPAAPSFSPAWQAGSWRRGAVFSAGIAGALLVLWGAAWALARGRAQVAPTRLPYVWRQGVANLQRPSNQTATIVLAIGFGAFLLGTLLLVQANLLRTLEADRRSGAPQPRPIRHPARSAARDRPHAGGWRAAFGRAGADRSDAAPVRQGAAGDGDAGRHLRRRRRRSRQRVGVPAGVPLDLPGHPGRVRAPGGGQVVGRPEVAGGNFGASRRWPASSA